MKSINRVLVSVSDKTGLIDFLRPLYEKFKFEIISTGGTAEFLKKNNFSVTDVSAVTEFPEVLNGRVKTLHPKIHMGLLADSKNTDHLQQIAQHQVKMFDMVVGNLYPFEEVAEKNDSNLSELLEKIDIGGPTFLRASAKNHQSVIVVIDPKDYQWVSQQILSNEMNESSRLNLALKVFSTTAYYDSIIFKKLSQLSDKKNDLFSDKFTLPLTKIMNLRYGENSQQQASLYQVGLENRVLSKFKIHQGKEISYNNLLDIDAALGLVLNFDQPCCVAVKHNNPCGVGWSDQIAKATAQAIQSDPKSIFGGILAFNRIVDFETAQLLSSIFLECLVATDFTNEALEVLKSKKNLRLISLNSSDLKSADNHLQIRSIQGHVLIQNEDQFNQSDWTIVGEKLHNELRNTILYGEKICAYLKSNAIAIVGHGQTLGLGMGQVNRVDAVEQALKRFNEMKLRQQIDIEQVVLVSDAFFPFPDSIELIAKAGIKWVVQPGGSTKDNLVLEAVKTHNLNMVLTHSRHFRH